MHIEVHVGAFGISDLFNKVILHSNLERRFSASFFTNSNPLRSNSYINAMMAQRIFSFLNFSRVPSFFYLT